MFRFKRFGLVSPAATFCLTAAAILLFAFETSAASHYTTNPNGSTTPSDTATISPATSTPVPAIPFIRKKPDFGGEACLTMALRNKGLPVDQDWVFDHSGVDPILGRGCVTPELAKVAQAAGLQIGQVWYDVNTEIALNQCWKNLLSDVVNKDPVVVVTHDSQNIERFVLIVDYDAPNDKLIYHNPNVDRGQSQTIDRATFIKRSLLTGQNQQGQATQQVVALRTVGDVKNNRLPAPTNQKYTDADYAQHIRKLKTRLPNDDFKIVLQKPFVVVGDGGIESVKRTAEGTVKWAVDKIKLDYFSEDPEFILDVWLFKDPTSYKKHNVELFGETPSTPYGFYSPSDRALVMDISTGGGTLVHEIVHPFMETNFGRCPSWFNEGLASLYEQSSMRDGHIIGLTNWRLRGLQGTISAKRLQSFETLCGTTTREFYRGAGTNYAQARYLCYYLQERGLLVDYYHAFRKNSVQDPGGYETLKQILKRDDIEVFQKEWEEYVLKLRF